MKRSITHSRLEPVSVLSNRVSAIEIWISKNLRRRLTPEKSRLPQNLTEFQRQRLTERPLSFWTCGDFVTSRRYSTEMTLAGWGAWIRTREWRNQNPLPYHLATPQCTAGLPPAFAFGRAQT